MKALLKKKLDILSQNGCQIQNFRQNVMKFCSLTPNWLHFIMLKVQNDWLNIFQELWGTSQGWQIFWTPSSFHQLHLHNNLKERPGLEDKTNVTLYYIVWNVSQKITIPWAGVQWRWRVFGEFWGGNRGWAETAERGGPINGGKEGKIFLYTFWFLTRPPRDRT